MGFLNQAGNVVDGSRPDQVPKEIVLVLQGMDAAGVDKAAIVQTSTAYGYDNSYVADAVTAVWGPGRVGMHLAPRSPSHGVSDSDPATTFGYVATELGKRGLQSRMPEIAYKDPNYEWDYSAD